MKYADDLVSHNLSYSSNDFVYGSYRLDYDKQENLQRTIWIQLVCVYSKNTT